MPYMGKSVDNKSSEIRRFDVTSSTSATHTLSWTAPSEQSLIVTINGVKQHEDAYSVSGTTLTLTSALVATDKLEVIGINDIGSTITPGPGSVNESQLGSDSVSTIKLQDNAVTTAKIADDQVTTAKIADDQVTSAKLANTLNITSGNSLTIDSGATITNSGTATGFGSDNTPAFQAYLSANQTLPDNTWTKIQFDTEDFDTDSAYDPSTNYRFTVPSGEGGKYFVYFYGNIYSSGGSSFAGIDTSIQIRVNAETDTTARFSVANYDYGGFSYQACSAMGIAVLSASDYVEFYAKCNVSPGYNSYMAGGSNLRQSVIGCYKMIGL